VVPIDLPIDVPEIPNVGLLSAETITCLNRLKSAADNEKYDEIGQMVDDHSFEIIKEKVIKDLAYKCAFTIKQTHSLKVCEKFWRSIYT